MAVDTSYLPAAGEGPVQTWEAMYPATVSSNADPLGQGRLQLRVPMVTGGSVTTWAAALGPYTALPPNNTQVNVAFLGGDVQFPVWIWNQQIARIPIGSNITTYSPGEPVSPEVGDTWFETFAVDGTTFYGPAQIWTFNSGTDTFSWVVAAQSGAGTNPLAVVEPNITGGTITGTEFIAVGTTGQILGYAGTPAAGNLNASVSPVAGTDSETNDYVAGVAAYGTGSSNAYSALTVYGDTLNGSSAAHVQATGATAEGTPAKLQTWAQGSGSTEQMVTWLTGPVNTADSKGVGIAMLSSETALAAGHLFEGYLMSVASGGVQPQLVWNQNGVNLVGGLVSPVSTLNGGAIISQTDPTFLTQTNPNGSFSRLTNTVWPIPAGDPVLGATYRLTTFGTGVWEGNTLSFHIAAFGQTFATMTIGGLQQGAGTSFMYDLVATMWIAQTGSSAIVVGSIKYNMSIGTGGTTLLSGANTANASGGFVGMGEASGFSLSPTTNYSMTVQVEFGGSNATQAITSNGSVFERIFN